MTLLDAHLEQISLCAQSISELPFPAPKIFTNALLQSHDITTLIRDTESHERALFSVPQAPPASKAQDSNRRNTIFNPNGTATSISGGGANAVRAPQEKHRCSGCVGNKNEVDVETLLEGAEKLLGVYPIPGAHDRIASMRQRHGRLEASLEYYESRIAEQAEQLSKQNRSREYADEPEEVENETPIMTEEDLRREEEEVRQLERKKRGLEDRVNSMGRDISGVLR
ncbi:hypothetical protein N0V90_002676 [Kalmusia sp. IMI 367209]|nr:hypothetical protein N0V90_002676 [Kalmusia sp. IMI 367209]